MDDYVDVYIMLVYACICAHNVSVRVYIMFVFVNIKIRKCGLRELNNMIIYVHVYIFTCAQTQHIYIFYMCTLYITKAMFIKLCILTKILKSCFNSLMP